MKEVRISDVTMKQPAGGALSFREKLELSKLLDRLGVDVIELEEITQIKADSLRVKSVAAAVKNSAVAVPVPLTEEGVETAWAALRGAKRPRLQVAAPVSTVQMEYLSHRKPEAMLEAIRETAALCRARCDDVEFIALDATRSDPDFLCQALTAAIEAGANTVTVSDSAGEMLPDEFEAFLRALRERLPALETVRLGVSCGNALAMADACALAALRAGADEVKTASYGDACVSLVHFSRALARRGESLNASAGVRMVELGRVAGQIARMFETGRGRNALFDSGVGREGESLELTNHDDRAAVLRAAQTLGYDLSEEDGAAVWAAFQRIARRKERIGARELDAIVASAAMQVPQIWEVRSYVINTGSVITAMAHIKLLHNGEERESVALGDGPIDASFLALEQATGRHLEMDDFQIRTVTEGHEAMGETVVRLRAGGRLYAGRGISTDIVGASIQAYVNALNKISYEEAEA